MFSGGSKGNIGKRRVNSSLNSWIVCFSDVILEQECVISLYITIQKVLQHAYMLSHRMAWISYKEKGSRNSPRVIFILQGKGIYNLKWKLAYIKEIFRHTQGFLFFFLTAISFFLFNNFCFVKTTILNWVSKDFGYKIPPRQNFHLKHATALSWLRLNEFNLLCL